MQQVRERVLLVDDEPQVLVALEDLLADDYSVLKTESGERALDLISREPDIAVVITDHRMPRMNGDEFLARLGESIDSTRILVTGFADLSGVIRAVNDGGIFAYVTKPWDDEDLRLKVKRGVEHYRLTRELLGERRLLQDLMNSVSDGIYFKNTKLEFVRVNRAFANSLGIAEPALMVGRRLTELVPSAESEAAESQERSVLAENGASEEALRRVNAATGARWFSESRARIMNAEGKVIGLAGIARDVTERVRGDEALRRSEERFREQSRVLNSVLAGMGDGAVVLDREGRFLLFNQRAERILGVGPKSVAPSELAQTYGIFTRDQKGPLATDQNPLLRAMAGEERSDAEVFIRNQSVRGANVAVTATPLRDDDGNLIGSIALLRDVTRQRELEQQLLESQKMEAVGRLAGSVAHDFNNLLSVILSYGSMVLKDLKPLDPIRPDIEAIFKAGERASDLTRQLLAFSRRQVLAPRVVDLNQSIRESQPILKRLLGENVELITSFQRELWRVRVDPGQIDQVVVNLVVNARDAMPDGGKLEIGTRNVALDESHLKNHLDAKPGRYVQLSISDTGSGMDRETQARIFEPFFTTKEQGKGTGLGLATVFGIIKQSGGHLDVESELGRGTRFDVFLPTTDESHTSVAEPVAPVTLDGNETILLVEDQDEVRLAAASVLRRRGYRVIEARNAGEALLHCERAPTTIDLMLTDMVMPQLSGRELADRLRALRPDMGVLFMSGYSEHSGGVLPKGTQYMQKPFTPDSLARRVRETLDLLRPRMLH
ncbi:MAG: response regulator [Myxococcota bacterium]